MIGVSVLCSVVGVLVYGFVIDGLNLSVMVCMLFYVVGFGVGFVCDMSNVVVVLL